MSRSPTIPTCLLFWLQYTYINKIDFLPRNIKMIIFLLNETKFAIFKQSLGSYLCFSFISPSILDHGSSLLLQRRKHWIVTKWPKWRPFHDENDLSSEKVSRLNFPASSSKRVNSSIVCFNVQGQIDLASCRAKGRTK